jgi:hypothetical protein
VFPALPLSFSLLSPHRHTTRWCRSLSRVAVSCWKCSRLSMMVLVLLGSICSSCGRACQVPITWSRYSSYEEFSRWQARFRLRSCNLSAR